MTKLYTVSVVVEYVIAVEEYEEPRDVATQVFNDFKYDMDSCPEGVLVNELTVLPEGWDDSCYPYCISGGDFTIKEIIEDCKNEQSRT